MVGGKDRFRMPVAAPSSTEARARRRAGPMGAAGREVAENVAAATEAQIEARRRNAADAKEYRAAQEEGRVLVRVPIDDIAVDDLPRDRLELEAVAASDEMEELKASIRARGQREPIEIYVDARGRKQLKKGWRRLTALRALHAETRDPAFAHATCRLLGEDSDRISLYIDMVEENAIREDVTFAEMAAVVIAACEDPRTGFESHDEALGRIYASLHRMKRSNIKQFVVLLDALGPALRWPKAIARDLGANVGRLLRERPDLQPALAASLRQAAGPEEQNAILQDALDRKGGSAAPRVERSGAEDRRQKYEFRHGELKVTARRGEVRIKAPDDFASIPRSRLEAAVAAFYASLGD